MFRLPCRPSSYLRDGDDEHAAEPLWVQPHPHRHSYNRSLHHSHNHPDRSAASLVAVERPRNAESRWTTNQSLVRKCHPARALSFVERWCWQSVFHWGKSSSHSQSKIQYVPAFACGCSDCFVHADVPLLPSREVPPD